MHLVIDKAKTASEKQYDFLIKVAEYQEARPNLTSLQQADGDDWVDLGTAKMEAYADDMDHHVKEFTW